jgi:hypothetical protein
MYLPPSQPSPTGGASMSDGLRGKQAPSLKLPTRQFLYARPSLGGNKKGGNECKMKQFDYKQVYQAIICQKLEYLSVIAVKT